MKAAAALTTKDVTPKTDSDKNAHRKTETVKTQTDIIEDESLEIHGEPCGGHEVREKERREEIFHRNEEIQE